MRQIITLACAEAGERLYLASKNERDTPEELQPKKYSPKLRRRALLTEVK